MLYRLSLYFRSLLYWVFLIVSTFIIGWAVVFSGLLPVKVRYGWGRLWAKSNLFALKFFCGLTYQVNGLQQLSDPAAIIFSKHQSAFECFVILADFPTVAWVLKRELLWIPIFGWALALIRPTAIDRSSGSVAIEQVVTQGKKSLDQGRWVVIFPEGTRTQPGSEPNYRIGGAILAERTAYPIYPVAHNSGEFWPKHSFIKWPGSVSFEVGPKISTKHKKAGEIRQQAQDWIEGKMQQISDPARWDR